MDLDGRLILLESGKEISQADLSKIILEHGTPIIIASDKRPVPRLIEKLAPSFSAVLMHPEEETSRRKKARTTNNFKKGHQDFEGWRNHHERDALVAVLFAWKRIRNLMEKTDIRLRKYRKRKDYTQLRDFVKSRLILTERNMDYLVKEYLSQKGHY